ncbi:MAG: S-layer homology domain-containing protein [Oscillospiraceae bacterium]|nr:S-layer homology domain-containing protein [Oscillospiraceae bacterium]
MQKRFLSLALALALVPFAVAKSEIHPLTLEFGLNDKFLIAIAPPANDSIPISNREELRKIGEDKGYPIDGKYHLTADIDLSGMAWVPITGNRNPFFGTEFKGVFDGQGYVIWNLTVMNDTTATRDGVWQPEYFAGLFASASSDAVIKNVGMENVNIDINRDFVAATKAIVFTGGISGYGGKISNCYVTGSISVTNAFLRNSNPLTCVGGISGANANISNCYSTASVSALSSGGWGSYSATAYAGGIIGCNEDGFSIINCYNAGSVAAGADGGTYDNSHAYVGGIAGYGVAGNSYWNIDSKQTVNSKELSSAEKKGLGYGIGQVSALTTEQMKQQSSFSGWDFASVWEFSPDRNSGYPILRAFSKAPNLSEASTWAHTHINEAYAKGFIPADLQINYTAAITRAEFCRMAVKYVEYALDKSIDAVLAERGIVRNPGAFTDVDDSDILAAAALGITSGVGNNLFNPSGVFSREQAATMVMNVCGVLGLNTGGAASAGFADMGSVSSWAVNGVNFCAANEIMSGIGGNNFGPQGTYSREQSILTFNNIKI